VVHSITCAGLLALLLCSLAASTSSAGDQAIQVIVHPDNAVSVVDREFVRSAFLKTAIRWPDSHHLLRPIDLPRGLPGRARFTRDILEKTPAQLRNFWVQRIFSGTAVPPPEADDPANAVAYVLAHPGGLGYVPLGTDIRDAKRVRIE